MTKQPILDKNKLIDLKVLFAMMALGHKSDREIAKHLGMTNVTVSRRRNKLEREGYIKEYTILPDFSKLGLEYIVITLVNAPRSLLTPDQYDAIIKIVRKHFEILCFLEDQSLTGMHWFSISVHKTYECYLESRENFQKELLALKLDNVEKNIQVSTCMFHTGKSHPKLFSLRQLGLLFNLN